MDLSAIDPSLRDAARRAPTLDLEKPWIRRLVAAGSAVAPGCRVEGVQRRIVRAGDIRLRVYEPATANGSALVWIHGGGLVMGSAAIDDRRCGETAREVGATVVSVDYRLAPRHAFPTALDDAHRGWSWLVAHAAELSVDPARIAVGGESAGGGLAANLVHRLHDEGADVAAQWLFSPMLDDRTAADRARDAEAHLIWTNRSNLVGWSSYLGDVVGAADLPPYAAAARRHDLSGLPQTWLSTTDIELFHREDVAYADRLRAAGVDVTLEIVAGAPHGFEAWAPTSALAVDLLARARAWLSGALA